MVSQLATQQEREQIRFSFMMFDRDGDGKIGREEFDEIYSKLDPSSEYRDAKKLFDIVDMNKNGVIDFTEW